tara:strand:+ start:250 stop:531 length:282 start_codon:yes stop_codon:yes gene_type:complete
MENALIDENKLRIIIPKSMIPNFSKLCDDILNMKGFYDFEENIIKEFGYNANDWEIDNCIPGKYHRHNICCWQVIHGSPFVQVDGYTLFLKRK